MENLIYNISISNDKNYFKKAVSNDARDFEINENNKSIKRKISSPINIPGSYERSMQPNDRKSAPNSEEIIITSHDKAFSNLNIDVENLSRALKRTSSRNIEKHKPEEMMGSNDIGSKLHTTVISTSVESEDKLKNNTKSKTGQTKRKSQQTLGSHQRSLSLHESSALNNQISQDNSSCANQETLRKRSEPDLKTISVLYPPKESKKSLGNSSPLIIKRLTQYQSALENWNSRSGKNPTAIEKKILAKDVLRKESSESNDSCGKKSIDESVNPNTTIIASKKKSLVDKFEKLSRGTTTQKRSNHHGALTNVGGPHKRASTDEHCDYTLETSESEKEELLRRSSHGYLLNSYSDCGRTEEVSSKLLVIKTVSESDTLEHNRIHKNSSSQLKHGEFGKDVTSYVEVSPPNKEYISVKNHVDDNSGKTERKNTKSFVENLKNYEQATDNIINGNRGVDDFARTDRKERVTSMKSEGLNINIKERKLSLSLGTRSSKIADEQQDFVNVRKHSVCLISAKNNFQNNDILVNETFNNRRNTFAKEFNEFNENNMELKNRRRSSCVRPAHGEEESSVTVAKKKSLAGQPVVLHTEEVNSRFKEKPPFSHIKQTFEQERPLKKNIDKKKVVKKRYSLDHTTKKGTTQFHRRLSVDHCGSEKSKPVSHASRERNKATSRKVSLDHRKSSIIEGKQSRRRFSLDQTECKETKNIPSGMLYSIDHSKHKEITSTASSDRRLSLDHECNGSPVKKEIRKFSFEYKKTHGNKAMITKKGSTHHLENMKHKLQNNIISGKIENIRSRKKSAFAMREFKDVDTFENEKQRRFSTGHPDFLSLFSTSPDVSDVLFVPRRSITPTIDIGVAQIDLHAHKYSDSCSSSSDSNSSHECNLKTGMGEHCGEEEGGGEEEEEEEEEEKEEEEEEEEKKKRENSNSDKTTSVDYFQNSILNFEEKPAKKDSGNYEDTFNSYSSFDAVSRPMAFSPLLYRKKTLPKLTPGPPPRRRSSVVPVMFSTIALDSSICNSQSDTKSDTDSSFSYDDPRKVSVIETLSISAVSKIPDRKRSHLLRAFNPSKKIDEESGFFDSHEINNSAIPANENNNEVIENIRNEGINIIPKRKRSVSFDNGSNNEPLWMKQYRKDSEEDFEGDIESIINKNPPCHFENDNRRAVMNLGDLKNSSLLDIADRSNSFNSMTSSPLDDHRLCDSLDRDSSHHSSGSLNNRRRKFGTTSIVSLDELPKRKTSRAVDWFIPEEQEEFQSYESCFIPEMVSRKMSMFGQLLTFDEFEATAGLEVVASKETRDIISESHGTLSSCSDISPYRPSKSDSAGNKLRIDEETDHDEEEDDDDAEDEEDDTRSLSSSLSSEEKFAVSDNEVESNLSDASEGTLHDNSFLEKNEIKELDASLTENDFTEDLQYVTDGIQPIESHIYDKKPHPDDRKTTTFSTMFGHFNYCLYEFIKKQYSIEKWKEICTSLHLTKRQIAMFEKPKNKTFDDDITDQIIRAATKVLHTNFNLFLQKLGKNYFNWCFTRYEDLLRSIATNLADFINNMDDIRRHIHKVSKINDDFPPSIYCLHNKGTLLMYYHSQKDKDYLEYFLIGFIKDVAQYLYGMSVRVALQQPRKLGENEEDFSIISIKAVTSLIKKPSVSKLQVSTRCIDLIIEPYLMDNIFPFHIMLDEQLHICQLGVSLNRLLEKLVPQFGLSLHSYFCINKPVIDKLDYAAIRNNLNTAFILTSRNGLFQETFANGLVLKGQMTYLESSKCLWFIGSPKVEYVHQLDGSNNLYLSDIPLHDATREVLLVSEQTHVQDTMKSQLQVLTNRLKETSKELALGKINTENILDEIFPKDVAERLMRDLPVPAVANEEVSILFTDIVGFTNICGKCDPEDVTDMLNNLYLEFDFLCEKFDLYKVETIGDAYMAVGGLHRKHDDHGRFTTAMGIEMIAHAREVQTPAGDEIQIRVGIHSGSVVSGVVGTRMPRYCLFGNNVTLANKMEATSEACKVHISPVTYLEIKHHQEFIFWERPRDIMPSLMQKQYPVGHTYFVSQRRPSTYYLPGSESEKRYKYMKPIPRAKGYEKNYHGVSSKKRDASSRKTSHTDSVLSDIEKYPPKLRKQLDALEKIQGYEYGKIYAFDMLKQQGDTTDDDY